MRVPIFLNSYHHWALPFFLIFANMVKNRLTYFAFLWLLVKLWLLLLFFIVTVYIEVFWGSFKTSMCFSWFISFVKGLLTSQFFYRDFYWFIFPFTDSEGLFICKWYAVMPYIAYWVGQKVPLGFSITSYGKTRRNFLANPIFHWFQDIFYPILKLGFILQLMYNVNVVMFHLFFSWKATIKSVVHLIILIVFKSGEVQYNMSQLIFPSLFCHVKIIIFYVCNILSIFFVVLTLFFC